MIKEHRKRNFAWKIYILSASFFSFFLTTRLIYESCNDLIFNFTNNSADVTFKNVDCHILPKQESVIRVELRLFCESFEQMKNDSRNKFGSEIS